MRKREKPDALQMAFILTGVIQADIAEHCGVQIAHVCNVLCGESTSAKIVTATAHLLGKPEEWVREQIAARKARRHPDTRPAAVQECDKALECADQE